MGTWVVPLFLFLRFFILKCQHRDVRFFVCHADIRGVLLGQRSLLSPVKLVFCQGGIFFMRLIETKIWRDDKTKIINIYN